MRGCPCPPRLSLVRDTPCVPWQGAQGPVVAQPHPRDTRPVSPRVLALEEAPDELFDSGDVPPHLQDRTVLLRVGEVKGVDGPRPNVLLPNYPCGDAATRCARSTRPAAPSMGRGPTGAVQPMGGSFAWWALGHGGEVSLPISPAQGLRTRADVCLAEQLGQAPHTIEGVEVVHVLVQPVHPILVLQTGGRPQSWAMPAPEHPAVPGPWLRCGERVRDRGRGVWGGGLGAPTWGSPVRMLARLGEQLLTAVKAFWKRRLRRASASRAGVRMAELL